MVTLWLDPEAELKLVDFVLPFDASYRPLWMGLGTLGLDLMAAVFVTSLLRQRIGVRAWRAVHWLAYLSWPVALGHTLGTGTDRSTLVAARVERPVRSSRSSRPPALAAGRRLRPAAPTRRPGLRPLRPTRAHQWRQSR